MAPRHTEKHLSHRAGWLRAAVLGANDGIVSTSSLVIGVAASGASRSAVLTAGLAGLLGGALSMAAGEYVSVSSQRDTEEADLAIERRELETDPEGELAELARIYRDRGLTAELADEVAAALTQDDALAAHARDELGLEEDRRAQPLQAAWASALSFSVGAVLPLLTMILAPGSARGWLTAAVTAIALVLLGTLGAHLGGAPRLRAATRVLVWGVIAMGATAAIGAAVG